MMNDQSTAIILFAYNRPDKLARLAACLALCPEFVTQPLYIFVDGPRTEDDLTAVEATAALAVSISHPRKTVCQRDGNLGLRGSLRNGISTVLERHESVIVLEDDLILGPHALDYLLRGLDKYRDEKRVASICAYAMNEDNPDLNTNSRAYFLPMTHPWGWATWRDRWQAQLETLRAPQEHSLEVSRAFKRAMNVSGLRNFSKMLDLAERGVVNSWWIYWHREAVFRHQVSLFPSRTHVINAGIDGSGTHASRWNVLRRWLPDKQMATDKASLPEGVMVDFAMLDQIVASREARYHRVIGSLGLTRRYLKQVFKK
ncbi:MAG: hypothetical protein V4858_21335 [Pseudomonadota bacterium]